MQSKPVYNSFCCKTVYNDNVEFAGYDVVSESFESYRTLETHLYWKLAIKIFYV